MGHVVEIIGMTKSSSGSELKKIQTVVVLGKKSTGVSPSLESHLAAVEVLPIGARETFTLRYDGKIEMPKLMNRWNVVKMVEESLKGGFQGELFFGKPSQMEGIKVVAKLEKTEELKREIRESPEFKKCLIEQQHQKLLTPICTIVRHQAASLDKIRLTIHTPKTWAKATFLSLLDGVSKALLLGNIESERIISGTEGVVIAEARADRISQVVTLAKVITPTREFVMKNLRLMGLTRFVLPATGIRTPIEVAALKLTGSHIPSTCRVEPTYIRTFDNMTVEYPINDCEHVLLLDGITEVQIIPSSGSMKVLVNGQPITLPAIGEQLIKKTPQGKILLIVQHFEDNVVFVHIPEQGLKVLTNGSMVEVVAPQLLKSRTVGLCGDMNGERSADLKTPGMCVLRPRLAGVSFMLNKSGAEPGFVRCSGLPAAIREEFIRESTRCPREIIIPTPVSELYERISLQMVKTCLTKPLSIKQRSVEFACVPAPSVLARSLEKRALAGEPLFHILSQYPTIFRKAEFEPVACKSDVSSMTL